MKAALLTSFVAVTVFAGSALAAATPVAPAPDARVDMHPVFSWTVPPGEVADTVYVATRPDTTPSGEFYEENIVTRGLVCCSDARQWAPTFPLFAGAYWWTVESRNLNTFASAFSTPSPFTVFASTRLRSIRVQRNSYIYSPSELDVRVDWFSNAHDTRITVGVYRGGQLLGRVRRVETRTVEYPTNNQTYLTWQKPRRVRKGTKLRLVVSVRGGAAVATSTRVVRAP
jgi:hypothetical protein